jgi:soluble lytic murein transglycosylase
LGLGLLEGHAGFQLALALGRLGLQKEARDALGALDLAPLRLDGVRGRESMLLLAELVARFGDERAAHHLARRELLKFARDIREPLSRRIALVAFPLAFRSEIRTHASSAGFEPDFIQGLMREESSLDPKAKSPVGARGLTQLMPATAKAVAKSLGLRGFHVDRLWEADTNIRIGSTYLGRLLRTFGHPGLAAAAYNAGPHAVDRWLSGATRAFDEFVEQIPYAETRGYVKRVLRSYAAYRYLYDQNPARALRVSLGFEKPSTPAESTPQTSTPTATPTAVAASSSQGVAGSIRSKRSRPARWL